jgi:protein-tyrosine phosphatase
VHRPAISVLFVCSGNICRSPAAGAIADAVARERGITSMRIESAGISSQHRGEPAHPLSILEGARRGYHLEHLARPIHPDDFADFDLIVAMDQRIVDDLRRLGGSTDQRIGPYRDLEPQQFQLLRRWDPYGMPGDEDVIDPRQREIAAYAEMYDVFERSIPPLIDHLVWLVEDIARDQAP